LYHERAKQVKKGEFKMALVYFDSNVCVGKRGLKNRREIWKSSDIIASMNRVGIAGALVYAGWSKDYAPDYGNKRLVQEIAESGGRFYGCYTIAPGHTGSFPMPEEAVRDLREKGMVAARMFPASHHFSTSEAVMGGYYIALENAGIPLFVDFAEIGWAALETLLEKHPRLNVVLHCASWPDFHNVAAYMVAYKNLYIDLSSMQTSFGVEVLVDKVGADRIVFGSALPKMSPGAARAFIDYADISDEEKQLIAGANLARLCNVPMPQAIEVENDFIAKEASEGKPISVYAFDSHAHFLEDGGHVGGGLPMLRGDLDNMLALGEKMGVDDHCVAPWLGIWTDSEAGNEVALDMMRRDKRVYPFVLIDPNYVSDIEGEAYKYHVKHKMPAMKMFYNRMGVRYNDPIFDPWWKIAEENHLFGLMDCGGYPGYLADMEDIAKKYPNVSIFLDHAGGSFPKAEEYAVLAKKYDNVYLQLTYTSVPEGMVEYLCAEGLADKTLYGTDAPMRDPRPQLGWVVYANVSVEDKKKILGGNMRKIADRCFKK